MTAYARADVLRILRITSRQMQSWERAGLIPAAELYSFSDLLQLKTLRELCSKKVRSEVIARSLREMRLAAGMQNPLLEAGVVRSGKRLAFRHHGAVVEPISGQYMLDFTTPQAVVPTRVRAVPPAETPGELFARGVALEEDPSTQAEAVAMYEKVLEMEPQHAAAHINLGTIHYNRHDFVRAERHYRAAVEADPRYALAYFDLGNVLDETGRLMEAVRAYKMALMIAPTYADAHYNLALAYEKLKLTRRALPHWQAYARLDKVGPWASHARQQIQKILKAESLAIVHRRG